MGNQERLPFLDWDDLPITPEPKPDPPNFTHCITIRQPWAELIISGKRSLEIRKKPFYHNGFLVVHASQKIDKIACEKYNLYPDVTGAIIGVVEMIGCTKLNPTRWEEMKEQHLEDGELPLHRLFYAWHLQNPLRLPTPYTYSGKLGIFHLEHDTPGLPEELLALLKTDSQTL